LGAEGERVVSRSGLKATPKFEGKSMVCIRKGKTPYEMVCEIFSALDVDRVIERGNTVLVKPNFSMLWKLPWKGSLTSPEFLEATVKAVRNRTKAGEIIIGEGGGGTQTWRSFFEFGVVDMAMKYNARPVDLNWDEAWKVKVPDPYVLQELWVTRTAHALADVIISVPVLKGWGSGVTLSLKNMMGTAPGRYYGFAKGGIPHGKKDDPSDLLYGQSKTLAGSIVDICYVNRANIALIDALTVMYPKNLPKPGTTLFKEEWQVDELNMAIGGYDPVAVDAVGTAVMGLNPSKILHIGMAAAKGLGTNRFEEILIEGESLDKVKHPCNPWHPGLEEIRES